MPEKEQGWSQKFGEIGRIGSGTLGGAQCDGCNKYSRSAKSHRNVTRRCPRGREVYDYWQCCNCAMSTSRQRLGARRSGSWTAAKYERDGCSDCKQGEFNGNEQDPGYPWSSADDVSEEEEKDVGVDAWSAAAAAADDDDEEQQQPSSGGTVQARQYASPLFLFLLVVIYTYFFM